MVQGFLEGLVIGFSIAAPVGPIGLLCIQRTLNYGRRAGLVSGLGAATADATYASIAGFGVTFVSSFLVNEQLWIRLLGGAFLILLGLRTFLSVPRDSTVSEGRKRLANDYASTFALTLSNPLTIVSFVAVFTGLGILGQARDYWAATELVTGVFAGSTLWWIVLSTGVGSLKGKVSPGRMRWVNRLSGAVIAGFGVVAILSLVL